MLDLQNWLASPPRWPCLCRHSCFSWLGKGADSEKHCSGPFPVQEETTTGNGESSIRLRNWSLRSGARKRRCGQEVGSWQDLWVSRACWGPGIHCPRALSHHRVRGRKDWKERKGKNKHLLGTNYPLSTVLGGSHMLPHESSQSFEITSVIIPILEMRKQRFKAVRTKILFGQYSGTVKYVNCLLSWEQL